MEPLIMSALAIAALCESVHILRTGIAEQHGAPLPWAERTTDHRKSPNRRVWP
jgi:hypothetical protein